MITYLGDQLILVPLATPQPPTLTRLGTAGPATYAYKVVAVRGLGHSGASAAATLTTGPLTLSGVRSILIIPPYVEGAVSFDVYRVTGGPSQGKIGSVLARNSRGKQLGLLRDSGQAALPGDPPTDNTTGLLFVGENPDLGLIGVGQQGRFYVLPVTAPDNAVLLLQNGQAVWMPLPLAQADDTTVGLCTFNADEFTADEAGRISLAAPFGQSANAGRSGYLLASDWSAFHAKQDAFEGEPEDVANKSSDGALGTSDTLYPTQHAVKTYVDTGLSGKQASLGYTPEDTANKSTNTSLGTSNTLYPSQNAVKTYVDSGLSGKENTLGFAPFANPMTTPGDLIVGGSSGAATRLAKGSDTQLLTMVAGAVAWAAPSSTAVYPVTASLLFDEATAVTGNLASLHVADFLVGSSAWGFVMANDPSPANGDSFEQGFFLAAGSYTLAVYGMEGANWGKIDWYIDNVLAVSGQDWYAASFVLDVVKTHAVSVATDGPHTLKAVVNGKNGASGSYYYALTKAWFK
jgi:hypothetical protein